MPTVTTNDRETAERIIRDNGFSPSSPLLSTTVDDIAAALAEQRERLTERHVADLRRIRESTDAVSERVRSFCRERIAELKGE